MIELGQGFYLSKYSNQITEFEMAIKPLTIWTQNLSETKSI